jgi:hypothetical protein
VVTDRIALALLTLPDPFDTLHRYTSPSSPSVTDGIVYDVEFPPMFDPFFCHW